LEPREHFVYGGSRFHPAQTEDYIRILPPPSYIAQLDLASIQLLEDFIQLVRQGVPPHMKIRIPQSIMARPTHVHTNPYGHAVHRSPHVEALMQIAAIYVYNSTSTYAHLVRYLLPGIESTRHNHAIRSTCPYCENYSNAHYGETENSIDDLIAIVESDSEFEFGSESEEDYVERSLQSTSQISLIEHPSSTSLQLPSPPPSPFQEATCDNKEQEPEEIQTNEELAVPVPFHPLVLAPTIGPFCQPSPPRFEPILLPLHSIMPLQQGLESSQSLIQQLEAHHELTDKQTPPWSDLVQQTMTAIKYSGPYLSGPPSSSQVHGFIFEPAHVLAYGPFKAYNPQKANDPSSQPIDYCIYLYPSEGSLESQTHFIYGGSNIHPIQIENFPQFLPSLSLIRDLDSTTILFLEEIVDMFRRGILPSEKLRIPHHLMQWPTWIETNNLGNVVHYSPFIEMLLQIASHYVNHPMAPYSQLLRRIHQRFDMFENYRITCVCPQCQEYVFSDEEEEEDINGNNWEFFSDPDISEGESSQDDNSSRLSIIESLPILQPYPDSSQSSQSLLLPQTQLNGLLRIDSPESITYGILEDLEYELDEDNDNDEMYDGTNEALEVEIKTIITDASPTSNNLQSEVTRNSTLSWLRPHPYPNCNPSSPLTLPQHLTAQYPMRLLMEM